MKNICISSTFLCLCPLNLCFDLNFNISKKVYGSEIIDNTPRGSLRRQRGPVVRTLGLHAAAPGANHVLTFGLDLFPVVPDSTLPRFENSQLVASCQLGLLTMFLLRMNLFLSDCKSGVPVNWLDS